MALVTLSAVVDLSKVKMKWQEPYVSEGLNHKVIPASSKGIYQGLKLVQNISSTRLVSVSPGSDTAHGAVHLSSDGFAMTYYDVAGTSVTLDLSSASLDNKETVITLAIVYEIGVATTANWVAYPVTDWNALSAQAQSELIVLGTVNVPAPATNITTSMIIPRRRTVAWDGQMPGAVPWSALMKNQSFEHGSTGSSNRYAITDWSNRVDVAVGGAFRIGTGTVRSGAKSLEFNKTIVGASTGKIEQHQEIPVTAGQYMRITGWIRQLIAPTGGSYTFNLYWGDQDSVASGSTSITASAAGTDAGFRKVEDIVEVPSGKFILKSVSIEAVAVTAGSTGVAAVFDDFQVYAETGSPLIRAAAFNNNLRQQLLSALLVEDPATYQLGQLATLLRFDKSTPANEGSLLAERKDQTYDSSHLPPALSLYGRIVNLGSQLLATEADALKARIGALYATAGSYEFTLIRESLSDSGTVAAQREYVSTAGAYVVTVNARWDGALWNKDVNGVGATKLLLQADQFSIFAQDPANNTPWVDGAGWTWQPALFTGSTPALFGHMQLIGDTLIQGSNVTPSLVVQTLKSPTSHTNLLLDVQAFDGRSTVSIDNAGRLYRKGAFLFDEFGQSALDTSTWVLTNTGVGLTQTSLATHTFQMTTGTALNNFYQINSNLAVFRKNFPRFRARVFTSNLNNGNILGQAARVYLGMNQLFLEYSQSTHASPTHWYLQADGIYYDTGIASNLDGGAGISGGSIVSIAVISNTQVLVTIHDQNDTFSAGSQVVLTVPSLGTGSRTVVAGVQNTNPTNPAPTLAVDFLEVAECSRLD